MMTRVVVNHPSVIPHLRRLPALTVLESSLLVQPFWGHPRDTTVFMSSGCGERPDVDSVE